MSTSLVLFLRLEGEYSKLYSLRFDFRLTTWTSDCAVRSKLTDCVLIFFPLVRQSRKAINLWLRRQSFDTGDFSNASPSWSASDASKSVEFFGGSFENLFLVKRSPVWDWSSIVLSLKCSRISGVNRFSDPLKYRTHQECRTGVGLSSSHKQIPS